MRGAIDSNQASAPLRIRISCECRLLTPSLVLCLCAERILVVLRDGRKIIGIMRSFDQFANLVLEHALERVIVGKRFADVPLGLYVIRGENTVLLGQIVSSPAFLPRASLPRRPVSTIQ